MIIRNFYDDKLAQASYLVGCGASGEAIVIDPLRDIQPYLDMATKLNLRIVAVAETHIHADFISGSREVSLATGAKMYLSDEGDSGWKYEFSDMSKVQLVRDGDLIKIGNLSLKVIHTPGHTPEHISFLLTDHPATAEPHSLFTGDFLFAGDVGRPDLLERAANFANTMEKGARVLFQSLKILKTLPDYLMIWPAHGAGSACGKSLGGSPVTTLGYERISNWALQIRDEDKFVDEVLAGQPEPPVYFKEMKRLNKVDRNVLSSLPKVKKLSQPTGQLIDVRTNEAIHNGNFEGAIAISNGKNFTNWAGWLVGFDNPVSIIAEDELSANQAAHDMAMIGLDRVAGWVLPADLEQNSFAPIKTVTGLDQVEDALVLDVRGINERTISRVEGSIHIPLGSLKSRISELPKDQNIIVHCASGARSPMAYSILNNAGFEKVWELTGGISAIQSHATTATSLSGS